MHFFIRISFRRIARFNKNGVGNYIPFHNYVRFRVRELIIQGLKWFSLFIDKFDGHARTRLKTTYSLISNRVPTPFESLFFLLSCGRFFKNAQEVTPWNRGWIESMIAKNMRQCILKFLELFNVLIKKICIVTYFWKAKQNIIFFLIKIIFF